MVVAGAGTGGTLAGIGRKLKTVLPSVEVRGREGEGEGVCQTRTIIIHLYVAMCCYARL